MILIGGSMRSGTTLLWRLCNQHPEMRLTYEFNNISSLGVPYDDYRSRLFSYLRKRGPYANRVLGLLESRNRFRQAGRILSSYIFIARYLSRLRSASTGNVDLPAIRSVLHELLPGARIVGDKYPAYVNSLDKLAGVEGLTPVIIYRDCRDVTSSTLRRIRTDWRNKSFATRFDMASKVASRWVDSIHIMERYSPSIRIIRYEDLLESPGRTLARVGDWLDVDPAGFPTQTIRTETIGKYKQGLTPEELSDVMDVAGETMARLGYL